MEMAELVDILPTLSLIEEETPSGPTTPSVMDMLESFGLGIGESTTFFDLEESNMTNGTGGPECHNTSTHFENTVTDGLNLSDSINTQPLTTETHSLTINTPGPDALSSGYPAEDTQTQVASNKASFPVRNQVEWDRPFSSSS